MGDLLKKENYVMMISWITSKVIPVPMFTDKFRAHHRRVCKWCELLAGILVGYETHLILLSTVCIVWVIVDALQLWLESEGI